MLRQLKKRYQFTGRKFTGGTATVYEALSPSGRVAIKVPRKRKQYDLAVMSYLLRREIGITKRLQPLRPFVPVVKLVESDTGEKPYMVMQFVDGVPYSEVFKAQGEGGEVKAYREIATALSRFHSAGVVHIDVKEKNYMRSSHPLTPTVILDLAAVYTREECERGLRVPIFSPYAPPEQILDREISPASDVYALGLMMLCHGAGKHPRSIRPLDRKGLKALVDRVTDEGGLLNRELGHLVLDSLEDDPRERPSMERVAQALENLQYMQKEQVEYSKFRRIT